MESRGAREGERKTITALFADLRRSVELMAELDPEEAQAIVDPALRLMIDAVHRYEGYVAQSRGDGILALFGAPIAYEDHPQRAIHAALSMKEDIARYADELRLRNGPNVEIGIGLNTGEVVVRSIRKGDLHADYAPIGHSTNVAARLESLAKPGTVLVSDVTRRLTEGYFEFRSLGAAAVKGVSSPIEVYEVVGLGPLRTKLEVSLSRGVVPFVGRESEMAQLRRALNLASDGRGQIVAVVGDAGVGKSRLLYEFRRALSGNFLVLEALAVSHGKASPYLPLLELLKNYFGIRSEDDDGVRRERITAKVGALDRALDSVPYLLSLLGLLPPDSALHQMDPQVRRQRTLEAVRRTLLSETLNQPVALILEDLHWIDSETEAFLELVSESIASARFLLLVNHRPEYDHVWGNVAYFTELRLDPLREDDSGVLLTALLGDDPNLDLLRQLIIQKAEGNPFFMQEIVQALVDQQVLKRDGGLVLTRPVAEIHLPPTVQAVLASRIDRLPVEEKYLVQTLSVLGRRFPAELMHAMVEEPRKELQDRLARLIASQFVYERPALWGSEYCFKHALTKEVAYGSLLVGQRRVLHERAARAIEASYADRLDEHYEALAYHYTNTSRTEKAVEYLERAGTQAIQRSAFLQAIVHLNRALDALATFRCDDERHDNELRLRTLLIQPLIASRGFAAPEVDEACRRARDLCGEGGTSPIVFRVVGSLASYYYNRAELRTALDLNRQLLDIAQRVGRPGFLIWGHFSLGVTLNHLGEFASAREHLEEALGLYEPGRKYGWVIDPGASSLSDLAYVLLVLGYPDQAREKCEQAIALARGLDDPFTLARALAIGAGTQSAGRNPVRCRELDVECKALSTKYGFTEFLLDAEINESWILAFEKGRTEEGVTQMRRALEEKRNLSTVLSVVHFLSSIATGYLALDRAEDGLALVTEAESFVERHDHRMWESPLHRIRAELLLKLPEPHETEAEQSFRRAIESARHQQAKLFELRAAVGLARLLDRRQRKEEARLMLAAAYAWFTEGFDTVDLKEAKALLDELSL